MSQGSDQTSSGPKTSARTPRHRMHLDTASSVEAVLDVKLFLIASAIVMTLWMGGLASLAYLLM